MLLRLWIEQIFGTPGIGLLFAACCVIGMFVLLTRYRRAREMIRHAAGDHGADRHRANPAAA